MERVLGVHIEGVGRQVLDRGTTKGEDGGLMFCTHASSVPDGKGGFDWVTQLIRESVGTGGMEASYSEKNNTRFAPGDFKLHAHGAGTQDSLKDLAQLFLYNETAFRARLTSGLGGDPDTDTTLTLDDATVTANQALHLHEEVVWVSSNDGGGSYTVERGLYGTTPRAHSTDTAAYQKPPGFIGRGITLYSYIVDTDTLTERSSGRITPSGKDTPAIWQDQTKLNFTVEQLLSGLGENPLKNQDKGALKVNRQANIARAGEGHELVRDIDGDGELIVTGSISQARAIPKDTSAVTGANDWSWWMVGDLLIAKSGSTPDDTDVLGSWAAADDAPEEPEDIEDDAYEVFVIAREYDRAEGLRSTTVGLNDQPASFEGVTIEDKTIYPYHVLSVVFSVMLSTRSPVATPEKFDVYNSPQMGADLRWLFGEGIYKRIHEEIQAAQGDEYLIDQMVEVADGGPLDVLEWAQKLLFSYGYLIARTKNGRLDLFRFRLPNVNDYTAALGNELAPIDAEEIAQVDGQGKVTDVIEARIGKLPWQDARPLFQRATDGAAERAQIVVGDADLTLDLPGIPAGNPEKAIGLILTRALAQQVPMPVVKYAVNDWVLEGTDLSIGAPCKLGDVRFEKDWFVNRFGIRLNDFADEAQYVGWIMSVEDDPHSGRHVISVILPGTDVTRRRAPFGIIESVTVSGGKTTLNLGATTRVGSAGVDSDEFNVGDQVQIRDEDWTLHEATYPTIDDITGDTIRVNGEWTTVPSADQYVRLAPMDTDQDGDGYYNSGSSAVLEFVYMFLADSNDTLGDDDLSAHTIGM